MNKYDNNSRKLLSKLGFALSFMAISLFVSQQLIDGFAQVYSPGIRETDWYMWLVNAITMLGVAIPLFYILLRKVPESKPKEVVRLSASKFMVIYFICMATMYLSNFFGLFIQFIIVSIKGEAIANPLEDLVKGSNLLYLFVYATLLAPIIEEVLFRKLLLNKLRRFGDLPAIIISGLAFGLFHMNLQQFVYASTLGFIFAYVALKTNTIRYTILLHILINFMGSTVAPLILKSGNISLILLVVTWILTSISIGILFIILYFKQLDFEKAEEMIVQKSIYFVNPGMIVFFLLCFSAMVMYIVR